jgi:hypothetical protein
MKNGKEIRRAGGSETTSWSQPGSRFAALRGQLDCEATRRFLGSPLQKLIWFYNILS